jgi:predicted outer membrane repeat protein
MIRFLHDIQYKLLFVAFLLISNFSVAQIYVGAWNPIRYPNTGTCGWAYQDDGAAGTSTDPYASIEKALSAVIAAGTTNQTVNILPDAYIQNWDYDSTLTEIRDNCDGHDLDYAPTITSALNGLQILGSASGCLTMLEALGTSNSISFASISGASNITISNVYFKGYSQAFTIDNSTNITFNNCVFEACNYGVTFLDGILINSTSSNTSVTFNNCKFVDNNKNTNTNALTIKSTSSTAAVFTTVNFSGCEFVCNQKDNSGGSVMITGRTISTATPTTVNFTNGVFANSKATSTAGKGGALFIGNNSKVTINGTYFLNNICQTTGASAANDGGGAISIVSDNTGLTASARTDVSITNALFYGNSVTGTAAGGAIALIGASGHTNTNRPKLTITNTIFEKNKSTSSGGAIYTSYGELNISNSTFKRDTAITGGAIAINQSTSIFTLANDSFINNNATTGIDVYTDVDFASSTNYFSNVGNIAGIPYPPFPAIDLFNRANNATVGNSWTQVSGTSSILNNHLRLGNTNDAWVSRTPSSYPTILTNGTDSISWAFNFYSPAITATRKGYFVIACNNSNFNAATANGYAVVFSTAGVKLVRFTGGVKVANTILINGSALAASQTASVKVIYNPITDTWRLFDRITAGDVLGTSDPRTGVTLRGSVVNTTYTNVDLPNLGSFWTPAGGTFSTTVADFDDIYQSVGAGIGIGSALTYINGASLVGSYSCTNGYCAAAVAATCLSNSLSNFVCTAANATGSISGVAFYDTNGNGIYDESQPLDSIYIILYDDNDNVIARYTTKASGTYSFNGLPSGTYKVAFTKLSYLESQTLQNQGTGNTDSDIDNTYYSMNVTINTSLTNTISDDNTSAALHFQNVSAGFVTSSTLPLELISFTYDVKNCNDVEFKWTTLSEFNVSHFELLKSENNNSFKSVQSIDATGNSNSTENTYRLNMIQNSKQAFYKLRIVDNDGSYAFSPIIAVHNYCVNSRNLELKIFPNPTTSYLKLKFNEFLNEDITIIVLDVLGAQLQHYLFSNSDGNISLNTNKLPNGNYIIEVKTNEKVFYNKFEKN